MKINAVLEILFYVLSLPDAVDHDSPQLLVGYSLLSAFPLDFSNEKPDS